MLNNNNIDWRQKYIELQKEFIEEAKRWHKRIEDIEFMYTQQLLQYKELYKN